MTQEGRAISARRYARPTVRQRVARGRRQYLHDARCRCGWTATVAGWRAALAVADAHWHQAHRPAWRQAVPFPSPAPGLRERR
jgi:hypothetical protein